MPRRWTPISSRNSPITGCSDRRFFCIKPAILRTLRRAGQTKTEQPSAPRSGSPIWMTLEPRGKPQEGQVMVSISAKAFGLMVSVATLGAAISFGAGTALAQEKNVTEDQIVRALAPEKKPLTRGLSTGPQTAADPTVSAAETKFVEKIRGRSTRSLSSSEREEIAAMVKDKPKIDLEINLEYNSRARRSWSQATPMRPAATPTIRTFPNAAPMRSSAI
jgi:hypothetical protein